MSDLVSQQCVDFVKSFEGFYPTPYLDMVGVKTIGYGMTGSEITNLSSVTEKQASDMLKNLLNNNYAQPLKNNLDSSGVNLNQNQFDALVSMAYNIGIGGLLGSTLYRNVCSGIRDVNTITENFCAWSHAGGKVIAGLLRRRQEEAKMFFGSGNKLENKIEVSKMKNLVVYLYPEDSGCAENLARHLQCPVSFYPKQFTSDLFDLVDNIYQVGGTAINPKVKLISGNDMDDSMVAYLKFIGKIK